MLLDVGVMAAVLLAGNILLRHFEPHMSIARRLLKAAVILAITALISYLFGRTGVWVLLGAGALFFGIVHGILLPRHGVNGWTAEPREKYYALRGWPPPPGKDR